jgi:hypothetical protein
VAFDVRELINGIISSFYERFFFYTYLKGVAAAENKYFQ